MPQARAIVPDQGGVRAGLNATGTTIPKYRIVKRSTLTDSIALATNGDDVMLGVTMAAIIDGYAGDVQVGGMPVVEAGVAIAIGAKIMGGADGKAAVATAGKHVLGVANSAALVDGDLIEVVVDRTLLPV